MFADSPKQLLSSLRHESAAMSSTTSKSIAARLKIAKADKGHRCNLNYRELDNNKLTKLIAIGEHSEPGET
jgi:hypothetical protein